MRKIAGISAFFLVTLVLILSLNQANAVCCFPYNMNYYIDPVTGDFVLNGELNNDSYLREPFGNTSYRFVFLDKNNNEILERSILLTDALPIKGGAVIPPLATLPFQVVVHDLDIKTVQELSNFRFDGTNTLDYFPWKPADLVVSSDEMTSVGVVHGKNGDIFVKWKISGNITNTHSETTKNVYVVASLRDKDDNILGVAGYSDDAIQPVILNGYETKDFVLFALVPASKTPSSVNMYTESDDSSMIFPYYKPIIMRDAMNFDEKHTTDPKKPIIISANITNISREDLDFNWIIQIKKSPKGISEGDVTEYPESRIAFIKDISGHIDARKNTILEYSWNPQSNGIYFYEMYVWDSSNAKALSYPFRQGFLTDNWLIVNSNLNSVTNQIKSGIPLDEIQCSEGLELAHKASNGNLVCIKPETLQKLRERGWAESSDNVVFQEPSENSTKKLVLMDFVKQDMQNPFYFYKIEELSEIPHLNEIYKFGSVNVDETQYRELYDSFHKKCLKRPDANMMNCGSLNFAFEYNSKKYWISEAEPDSKYSREITILSISPQNVTLPEPKNHPPKTTCNENGVCFTPE